MRSGGAGAAVGADLPSAVLASTGVADFLYDLGYQCTATHALLRESLRMIGVGTGAPDLRPLTPAMLARILVKMANSLEGLSESVLPGSIDKCVSVAAVCAPCLCVCVSVCLCVCVSVCLCVCVCVPSHYAVVGHASALHPLTCARTRACVFALVVVLLVADACRTRVHLVRGRGGAGAGAGVRTSWDVDVLLDVVRDDFPSMDYKQVVACLDFPGCDLQRPEV